MPSSKSELIRTVCELAQPICGELGLYLWDVEYKKDGGRRVLRLLIDKEGGAGIDECEAMSRAIDPLLDAADPIPEEYTLEVSTPGMERALRTEEHFARSIGEDVEARLYTPIDGKKSWRGKLLRRTETELLMDCGTGERAFPLENVSLVKLSPDFSKYFKDSAAGPQNSI